MPSKQDGVTLLWDKTCFNCKYEELKSNVPKCAECMQRHSTNNRFPLWEELKCLEKTNT